MADEATWAKAQADYRAGKTLASICKKHRLTMGALCRRIRDEGWTRPGQTERAGKTVIPSKATAERNARIDAALEEAIADIIKSHKSLSQTLRGQLDAELAEYQEIKRYMMLVDPSIVDTLAARVEPGQENPELVKYLFNCFSAFNTRLSSIHKLVGLYVNIVDSERRVWALDKQAETAAAQGWDDLLEQAKEKLAPRQLPPNVADFERKLRERQGT